MADDDKKKGEDYSELSDLFDNTGSAPSLDDLLKDLGSDTDLDDLVQEKSKKKRERKRADDVPTGADFDALFADSPSEPMPPKRAKDDMPTGADFDALFADSPVEPPVAPRPKKQESVVEKNIFDDMSADFPEEKPGQHLGDDALFDYEPQSEASFDDLGHAGSEGDLGDMGMGDEEVPPPKKGINAKRTLARLGVMLVLVLMIYGALKFFLAKGPEQMAAAPAPATPMASMPTAPAPAEVLPIPTEMPPMVAQAPEMAPEPSATPETEMPTTLPVPGTVSSGLPSMEPEVTIPSTGMTTAMVVPNGAVTSVPVPTVTEPVSSVSLGTGDVNEKLDKLALALQSIDQRLSQVGSVTGTEQAQRLERLVNDSSAPGMQATLESAVKKMQALDAKLERITELQQQVRLLNSEVQSLKEDVVTQTNIVGEQQRAINDNTQTSYMQEPAPVKMMVQAAIPGRAWLRSERGELFTVIPGDEVPGYGRVVSIDAASGTVVTSSRAVFREQ